jgi:hypothetical protein
MNEEPTSFHSSANLRKKAAQVRQANAASEWPGLSPLAKAYRGKAT